jgi:hypothetical protein
MSYHTCACSRVSDGQAQIIRLNMRQAPEAQIATHGRRDGRCRESLLENTNAALLPFSVRLSRNEPNRFNSLAK